MKARTTIFELYLLDGFNLHRFIYINLSMNIYVLLSNMFTLIGQKDSKRAVGDGFRSVNMRGGGLIPYISHILSLQSLVTHPLHGRAV